MELINEEDIQNLRSSLDGSFEVVDRSSARVSEAGWNGLLKGPDPFIATAVPAYIVKCATPADACKAVQFGIYHNLKVLFVDLLSIVSYILYIYIGSILKSPTQKKTV